MDWYVHSYADEKNRALTQFNLRALNVICSTCVCVYMCGVLIYGTICYKANCGKSSE